MIRLPSSVTRLPVLKMDPRTFSRKRWHNFCVSRTRIEFQFFVSFFWGIEVKCGGNVFSCLSLSTPQLPSRKGNLMLPCIVSREQSLIFLFKPECQERTDCEHGDQKLL